jgi:hypothetical protein
MNESPVKGLERESWAKGELPSVAAPWLAWLIHQKCRGTWTSTLPVGHSFIPQVSLEQSPMLAPVLAAGASSTRQDSVPGFEFLTFPSGRQKLEDKWMPHEWKCIRSTTLSREIRKKQRPHQKFQEVFRNVTELPNSVKVLIMKRLHCCRKPFPYRCIEQL